MNQVITNASSGQDQTASMNASTTSSRSGWKPRHVRQLGSMWKDGMRISEMAQALQRPERSIKQKMTRLGLPYERNGRVQKSRLVSKVIRSAGNIRTTEQLHRDRAALLKREYTRRPSPSSSTSSTSTLVGEDEPTGIISETSTVIDLTSPPPSPQSSSPTIIDLTTPPPSPQAPSPTISPPTEPAIPTLTTNISTNFTAFNFNTSPTLSPTPHVQVSNPTPSKANIYHPESPIDLPLGVILPPFPPCRIASYQPFNKELMARRMLTRNDLLELARAQGKPVIVGRRRSEKALLSIWRNVEVGA